ncbi:hypothetical protein B0H17DRAFT_1221297 [Mycena rosella]|uniref:Uncharacterized protein n=1 Tax=Mycena rosella TaxID=1033263 RepID=A0AAD7B5C6_MYCRO|nr:hypothetical protein B0H17DRAFT_1221297 [Mycena rosella]
MVPFSPWNTLLSQLYTTSMSLLFYGLSFLALRRIYLVLFILSTYTLSRRKTAGRRILLLSSWAMFTVGSAILVIDVLATAVSARMVQAVDNPFDVDAASKPHLIRVFAALELVRNALFAFNTGVTFVLDPRIPYILGILTNIILVVLTASRIWWIRRQARVVCASIFDRRYGTALTLLLETGGLYCLCGILLAAFATPDVSFVARSIFYGLAGQELLVFLSLPIE